MHYLEFVYSKNFPLTKSISFEAIKNNGKPNGGVQTWTEVCHQIYRGREEQTMWNLQKNVWCVRRSMFCQKMFTNGLNIGLPLSVWVAEKVRGVETHWLLGK